MYLESDEDESESAFCGAAACILRAEAFDMAAAMETSYHTSKHNLTDIIPFPGA